jgi:uncharacterized protein (TIGR03083 family)
VPLSPPPVVDTRALFRPVSSALIDLLRELPPDDFSRSTIAGSWTVRDVLAHLVDLTLRRVSFQRDRLVPPPPPFPIESDRDFVRFINTLNREWVAATRRLSPQVLTELFELASRDLAAFFEARPLDAPALFGVSWAGEERSAGWFDIGREFTELWHHQMQIRMAVGAPPLADARYLKAVLDISVRALPHAYRDVSAEDGATITIVIDGPAGGRWALMREDGRWAVFTGTPDRADARVRFSDDAAWRLLYNALPVGDASTAIVGDGRADLITPIFDARSVIV